jgi:hypothetical protein
MQMNLDMDNIGNYGKPRGPDMVVAVKKRNVRISPLRSFLTYRNADLLFCLFGGDIHTQNCIITVYVSRRTYQRKRAGQAS